MAVCLLLLGLGSQAHQAGGSVALAQETTPVASSTDLFAIDTDFDGCSDGEELGNKSRKGGRRDPNNPLDFFDVNFDRKVTVKDAMEVRARYGAERGDTNYDLAYDRAQMGDDPWELGPGDGMIDRADINAVLTQLGDKCKGAPIKSFESVCAEEQSQAQSEGFDDFSCSTAPLPTPESPDPNKVPRVGKQRDVQVSRLPDNTVVVDKLDQEVTVDASTAQPLRGEMMAMAAVPPSCVNAVCWASVSRKIELKHLFGLGPNCAWLSFKQRYSVYYPYRALVDVPKPTVSSGAWAPCAQSSRDSWLDKSGMPYSATSGADIHWKVGIPSPWGTVGFREFNPVIHLWFNGSYEARWI